MAGHSSGERLKRKRNADAKRVLQSAYEKAAERVQATALRAVETLASALDEAPEWRDRIAAAKELTRLAGLRPPEQVEVTHYSRLTLDQLKAEALGALARLDAQRHALPEGDLGPVGGAGPIQAYVLASQPVEPPTETPPKNPDPPKYRPKIVADYEEGG